jgi:hypothetical protein
MTQNPPDFDGDHDTGWHCARQGSYVPGASCGPRADLALSVAGRRGIRP